MRFRDRREAGQKLAEKLAKYRRQNVVIYALPRGGVVVAAEIARELGARLGLIITRKIGYPLNPEYAVAAVAEDGCLLISETEQRSGEEEWFDAEVRNQQAEARRRREKYLGNRKSISTKGKTAILVDDGIATGLTAKLAIRELRHQDPAKVVLAVPVLPVDTARELLKLADELVALEAPEHFLGAVGAYYIDFRQIEDEDVVKLLGEYGK